MSLQHLVGFFGPLVLNVARLLSVPRPEEKENQFREIRFPEVGNAGIGIVEQNEGAPPVGPRWRSFQASGLSQQVEVLGKPWINQRSFEVLKASGHGPL